MRLFSILLFLLISHLESTIFQVLNEIPKEDYDKLEAFFDYLIHNSTLGYSLCGLKPVSIETVPYLKEIPTHHAVRILIKCPGYAILRNGCPIWVKYSKQFKSINFVFRYSERHHTLVLINKIETKKVIDENLELFQKYTALMCSSEGFFKCNLRAY